MSAAPPLPRASRGLGPRLGALGTLASIGFGVLLWSQVCSGALEVELSHAPARWRMVALYCAPLALLVGCLALRRPRWALLSFLGALVPCFGALPGVDARALQGGGDALTLGLSAVAFAFATTRLTPQRPPARADLTPRQIDRRFWRLTRLAAPRLLLVLAFFTLPLVGLYSAQGQANLRQSFPQRPADAAFLIHIVHLFIASVATYTAILSPSINRTLDAYELREALRATRSTAHAKRLRRSLSLCALLLPLLAFGWWWFAAGA
jgi:hypothetical protein